MVRFVYSVALISCAAWIAIAGDKGSGEEVERSLVTVRCPCPQVRARLLNGWQELPGDLRQKISAEIVTGRRLGLSSTGTVELIGVYTRHAGNGGDTGTNRLFHLRQTDRFGSRLFWSALFDPADETFRVLYHIDTGDDEGSARVKLGGLSP
jgi:hypothetical protein